MKELESDLNAYIFRGIITPKVEEEIKRKMAAYGINS